MARQTGKARGASKDAPKRKKQDTTVPPIPLSFDDAVKALLGTPPPKRDARKK
jgi:hypothetical protein